MKKAEIKKGKFYESKSRVVECLDLGEGRFPRVPKFREIFPPTGREMYLEPREISREMSAREMQVYQAHK